MTTTRRNRVDWDEEIRKTDNIKKRGFLMSGLSFALACVLIFGMSRATGKDIEIPRAVLVAVCFFVSCVIFGVVMRRRAKKKEDLKSKKSENE